MMVVYLGWVNIDFGYSTVHLVVIEKMRRWQKTGGQFKMRNIKHESQPNQGTRPPVTL